MMQLHGVGEQYDEQTWQEIVACMAEHSIVEPDVLQSSDGGWNGFIQYSESDGQPDGSDPWRRGGWIEWDPTPLGDDNNTIPGATEIQINEPCNFASNAAYCRTAVAMCAHTARGGWNMAPASVTGLVQSYVSLCMGSAFFHASGTSLGGAVDNMPIGHLALIAHQAAMATIPYQPIIHDLADAPRSKDGNGFAKEMTALFINVCCMFCAAVCRAPSSTDIAGECVHLGGPHQRNGRAQLLQHFCVNSRRCHQHRFPAAGGQRHQRLLASALPQPG
eukprot:TRINITY_DN223_c0_g1_i10.p1 TRINITY_DN223_c0_g1~~TRINITY_DN223_c0_g1_i10.p1  ORF type:complete len:305 (+),score=47.63 TRINITY_DN223_c0_g1_i10:88-915(+)